MHLAGKQLLAAAAAACLLAGGGAAYAFWTAGGTGTGSAFAGTTVPLTINQVTALPPLVPGGAAQVIGGTFSNPNPGPVYVTSVTASILAVTRAVGAPAGHCGAEDFTLAGAVMTVSAEVPAGESQGSWSGASLRLDDTGSNQDACQGATVTIAYRLS